MPVPDYQTLMLPVLRLLGDAADHAAGSVIEALASEFRLTPEEREQLVGSQRVSLMASRAHWAMTYLAQAGLTARPRRGVWRITDEGGRLLASDPERIDNALLAQYEGFQSFISRSAGEPGVDEAGWGCSSGYGWGGRYPGVSGEGIADDGKDGDAVLSGSGCVAADGEPVADGFPGAEPA